MCGWLRRIKQHQDLLDQLSKLKGIEFDRAYAKDMVTDHEKAIEQFEIEAKKGKDSDMKAWAEKWLPIPTGAPQAGPRRGQRHQGEVTSRIW